MTFFRGSPKVVLRKKGKLKKKDQVPQNSNRTTRNSSKSKERNSRKKSGKSVKKIVNDDSRVETGNDNDDKKQCG